MSQEIQICRARSAMHFGRIWTLNTALNKALSLYSVSSGILTSVKHIAHLCRSLLKDRLEMNFIPLKLSKVIPVYKVIDESDPSGYRSISPTSIFNRVYNKMAYYLLKSYLENTTFLMTRSVDFMRKDRLSLVF